MSSHYSIYVSYIFHMVALSLISLLGTTGNGLVIWFTAFRMKKTVNSVWLLSLAVADFTFCLFLPLTVTYLALSYTWPFGTFMCHLNHLVLFLNLSASVLQLTVISIDRCIATIFPVWCQNHRNVRMAVKVVAAVWILSLIFSIPYCQVIVRFIGFFIIPFVIILSCYMVIFWRIHRNRMTTSTEPFKVIAAIIASFFICWFPYHLFSVWLLVAPNDFELLVKLHVGTVISTCLAYANSCVNPVLYVFMGRDFKETFWRSIQSALEKAFSEDANQPESNRNMEEHMSSAMSATSQL
ncbi:PREDICTED: C3a anaphylatoxin chemotactic receptor-like [Nanorana parkeri]|uniref:C3a anaphylatoxin chemotactic receptor-like n=1 Tax=Nanorana parkeri TaxID=125878 RepID=UPI0008543351|nr:PREDICTED: C3a anaphylatoxin chemotactic receptor-like [Nanorana parkeri]